MRHGPLPAFLARPSLSARLWAAIAAGIGGAACAYAGLYPQFDHGALRVVIALTCVPFAAAVVAAALSARSAAKAFARAIGLAAILGVASTMVPAAVLTHWRPSEFFAAAFFGAFFGAPTGLLYGLPLATLAACAWRHVHAPSRESSDRGARVASLWLVAVCGLALAATSMMDAPTLDYATDTMVEAPRGPSFVAAGALLASIAVLVWSTLRLRKRTSWIARVRDGLEPAFRLRPMHARDGIHALPRLGHGTTVVEWLADEDTKVATGHAYRTAACGVAVAVVGDQIPIGL